MQRLAVFYRSSFTLLLGFLCVSLILLAWSNRFIQDDAFISFRYAHHLLEGKGLVWNEGERTEGYTNFLWTLLLAGGMASGFEPILFSQITGLACFSASLLLTYQLALLVLRSRDAAIVVVLLLGANFTFSSYATGGLETQLQTALVLGTALSSLQGLTSDRWTHGRCVALSALASFASLTRLDSALLTAILFIPSIRSIWGRKSQSRRFGLLTALLLPASVVLGSWLLWKNAYYGDLLPNSFYVKVSSTSPSIYGIRYLVLFATSYLLWPHLVGGVMGLRSAVRSRDGKLWIIVALPLLWSLYIVAVGGDFMEFRFLTPVLPFVMILLGWLLFSFIRFPILRVGMALLILAGSLHHQLTFSYSPEDGVETIPMLEGHLLKKNEAWIVVGKTLADIFGSSEDVTIATTAAGAIPYYSRLRTIDMLGVNDRWVAGEGRSIGSTPGHHRMAPLSYLLDRGVNLVISHPMVLRTSSPITKIPPIIDDTNGGLRGAMIVEMPINGEYKLIMLYLRKNPVIDRAIADHAWKVHELVSR